MQAILHGTWIARNQNEHEGRFFVWAERGGRQPVGRHSADVIGERAMRARVRRHPHAATTIEIAALLAEYVPEIDWRAAERLTRVALLPSYEDSPLVPRWLVPEMGDPSERVSAPDFWRLEGLGVPPVDILHVLAVLPVVDRALSKGHRLGNDLRYWGLAAKFALELLAKQRYVPGLRASGEDFYGRWLPLLDRPKEHERFQRLGAAMPPACRAVVPESGHLTENDLPRAEARLYDFIQCLVDGAVRTWTEAEIPPKELGLRAVRRRSSGSLPTTWWQSLLVGNGRIPVARARRESVTQFYRAWQRWSRPEDSETGGTAFRLCLRLEPPHEQHHSSEGGPGPWILRYMLQAQQDPSLVVTAEQIWEEQDNVLSYVNQRYGHPGQALIDALTDCVRICPPIRRSLGTPNPTHARLSVDEAYDFLQETTPLLEAKGVAVLAPAWWSDPDARLRVRVRLGTVSAPRRPGGFGMQALVHFDWQLALGDQMITYEELERLAALKAPLVQLRGQWVLLHPSQIKAALAFWQEHHGERDVPLSDVLPLVLSSTKTVGGVMVEGVELDDELRRLADSLKSGGLADEEPPDGLNGELRPYQLRGYAWMRLMKRWGFGACLADDMGLGKTIQAIALLLREHNEGITSPSLVVCPTSVVGNWQREIERFAPTLCTMVHHGGHRALGCEFVERASRADVVISTYGLVRRDIGDLDRVQWNNVILDEAQNIKNPHTKQARATYRLQGAGRYALTGTPIENRLLDLWSIMSFLNAGYLGGLSAFQRAFISPIERYQDERASERLRAIVQPFVLRRVKTDPEIMPSLPEKQVYRVYCHLTREQASLYQAIVTEAMATLDADGAVETPTIGRRGRVLAMLTRLKQVCDHPALYFPGGDALAGRSGKLERLCEMLEEVLSVNDHALVFTQYAQMGGLLQRHLESRFGREVLYLHGGTPQKQRDRMVQRFMHDPHAPNVFVLSLKAGGTGLNLMRANHVFHFDRWWNPAVEDQATDRAYRIGQERDVQVHKLICLGTLEERIDQMIESKRSIAESVVGSGDAWLTEMDTESIERLVTLRDEALESDDDDTE